MIAVKRVMMGLTIAVLLLSGGTGVAAAEDSTIKEMLKHADQARGNLEGIVWSIMITTNENGSKESRGMTVKVKGNNTLARFTSPTNMNDRMVLMKDRNMWFIRSGLNKPVSLSPRQKLLGDAANGDIASTNYVQDYEAKLVGEETFQGEACVVLDLKAKNKNVTYDRIKYWISKSRQVGMKAEFYTLSGMLFKTAEFRYDNKVNDAPFVSELLIRDAIQKNRETVMKYSNVRIERIPDSMFNLTVLVR